jgi:CIC family chloride channel protein
MTSGKQRESVGGFTLYVVAVIAGVLAGVVGTAFREALVLANQFRLNVVEYFHQWPLIGWVVPVGAAAIAVAIARYIVVRVPESAGSGVQRIEAQVRRQVTSDPLRVVPAKFVGGVLAIGSGLALGREGPTVQMAAAIGGKIARYGKLNHDDQLTIQSALAGAGLGVAFNAPLAGPIFVVEELTKTIQFRVIVCSLLATGAGVGVMRLLIGGAPDFAVIHLDQVSVVGLAVFVLFGLLVGLLGAAYSKTTVYFMDLFARAKAVPLLVRAAIVGGAVGLLGWFLPDFVGPGDNLIQELLIGSTPLMLVFAYLVVRWFLGPISYSVGTPGGLFAPLLVVGGAIGAAVGGLLNLVSPTTFGSPIVYVLVGMSALFAAVVRAPITGIALVVEMTAITNQFVPLMLATAAAMISATMTGTEPIYDTLRHRLLATGSPAAIE